LESPC